MYNKTKKYCIMRNNVSKLVTIHHFKKIVIPEGVIEKAELNIHNPALEISKIMDPQ